MTERLMGVETEYAFLAFRKDGTQADAHQAMSQIEHLAERHIPHLPARGQRGIYLQNGSRFYRDYGGNDAHQEMTTPECPNPWDAVRYIVANEQILLGLSAQLLLEDGRLREVLYLKHNVDYSGARTSWGSHESYSTRTPIQRLPLHLVPHLVSRLVFTGAGGFNSLAPNLEFMLSPRVAHLSRIASLDTERSRPIFNTRDEALSTGDWRRLHVICGESLCSHTSMWLRSATTALVVALVDGGTHPGADVTLADPVGAMQSFARDPACRVTASLEKGGHATAIEIQRHYLALAETHVGAPFMPPWAAQVCRHWRAVLDQLERGAPESVATTLDWAIKFSVFSHRLQQEGFDWREFPGAGSSARAASLRQELYETDMRYGQLGERGLFERLDRAGVLSHRFPGVDNFPHAVMNPPNLGRARLRGNAIRCLSGQQHRGCCDWTGVWDLSDHKFLDLSRPFEASETWRDLPPAASGGGAEERLDERMMMIQQHHLEGLFEQASLEIQLLECLRLSMPLALLGQLMRLKARVQARRGHLDGVSILNDLQEHNLPCRPQVSDYLYVLRFTGLTPRPEFAGYVQSVVNGASADSADSAQPCIREHWAVQLLSRGQADEAERVIEAASTSCDRHVAARLRRLTLLANAKGLLGKTAAAVSILRETRQQQEHHRYHGDLVDLTLPTFAKVVHARDVAAARAALFEARIWQSRARNHLGLVRTLLLDARLAGREEHRPQCQEAILALSRDVPALERCPLFNHIIQQWEIWTRDLTVSLHGDLFWGL